MSKYEQIKYYYEVRLWKKWMVANAVEQGAITAEEYKAITGEDYVK